MIEISIYWIPLIIIALVWIIQGIVDLFNKDLGFISAFIAAGITMFALALYSIIGLIAGICWLFNNVKITI